MSGTPKIKVGERLGRKVKKRSKKMQRGGVKETVELEAQGCTNREVEGEVEEEAEGGVEEEVE